MFCGHCGYKINDGEKFCPQCGTKIRNAELSEVTEEIKKRRTKDLSTARLISKVYLECLYREKYDTIIDYEMQELGLSSTMAYTYVQVIDYFLDGEGNCLIEEGEKWGIAKLTELIRVYKAANVWFINELIKRNVLYPEMSLSTVREKAKQIVEDINKNGYLSAMMNLLDLDFDDKEEFLVFLRQNPSAIQL